VIHNRSGGRGRRRGRLDRLRGCVLKPYTLPNGYRRVFLSTAGRQTGFYVHHLVLTAFVGTRPEGAECCCHGNRDKVDNHLGNLRWGTAADNRADAVRHSTTCRGERNGAAKLTEADVRAIRGAHARGVPLGELAGRHGVTRLNVRAVVLR